MSQHDTLEPCPFCGALPDDRDVGDYFVSCPSCGIDGPAGLSDGREAAANAWNRRAALSATQPAQGETALQKFTRFKVAETKGSPVEQLHVFCSFAMNGQDWFDVEPFFDRIREAQAAQGEPAEHWHRLYLEKCQQYNDRVAQLGGVIEGLEAEAAQGAGEVVPLQDRVHPWLMACFGPEIAADRAERNHRFLEEALELVQACGCTASEAHQLVDYTFGRPIGEKNQEVGGVMITLAALCLANGLDMHDAGETELSRIWTMVEKIRAKQAAKPKCSPLPQHVDTQPAAGADVLKNAARYEWLREQDNEDFVFAVVKNPHFDVYESPEELDAAIDAAIAASGRQS